MGVKVFRSELQPDSESAYRHWLSDNPDGYVVNTLKTPVVRQARVMNALPGFIGLIVKESTRYLD